MTAADVRWQGTHNHVAVVGAACEGLVHFSAQPFRNMAALLRVACCLSVVHPPCWVDVQP